MDRILTLPAFVASLAPKNVSEARELLRLVPRGANAVEFRLDLARERIEPDVLVSLDPRCVIVTYRSEREGGRFTGSIEQYRRLVEAAYLAGATVDVEIATGLLADRAFCPDRRRVIASSHQAACPSGHGEEPVGEARVFKFVGQVGNLGEALGFGRRERLRNANAAFFPMGAAAPPGRILASKLGSPLTYGSVGIPTAPGQLDLSELLSVYRVQERGAVERLFGIVAKDPLRTLSPTIHNELFRRRTLPYFYLPLPVDDFAAERPDQIDFDPPFTGFSITIPWKEAATSVGAPDENVRATGVANTLVRSLNSRWLCFNTDVEGVFQPLAEFGGGNGRSAMVVGNGGAARAAIVAAKKLGYDVLVAGRDYRRVKPVADRFGIAAVTLCDLPKVEADLWINATPLGASDEDPLPLPRIAFTPRPIVFDCVYRRDRKPTRLIEQARAAGCPSVDGLTMLAHQAAGQAKLFGVDDASAEEILEILGRRR